MIAFGTKMRIHTKRVSVRTAGEEGVFRTVSLTLRYKEKYFFHNVKKTYEASYNDGRTWERIPETEYLKLLQQLEPENVDWQLAARDENGEVIRVIYGS